MTCLRSPVASAAAVLLTAALLGGCESDTSATETARTDAPSAAEVTAPDAPAGSSNALDGTWTGTIDYQGYEVSFTVAGGLVQDLQARMLADCDGDGYTETFSVFANQPFPVAADGSVDHEVEDRYDQSTATIRLEGRFGGDTFTGFLREVDSIDGVGTSCDTLERTFTATRG